MWGCSTWGFTGPHGRVFPAIVLLLRFPYLECVTGFYQGKGQWVERFENKGPRQRLFLSYRIWFMGNCLITEYGFNYSIVFNYNIEINVNSVLPVVKNY